MKSLLSLNFILFLFYTSFAQTIVVTYSKNIISLPSNNTNTLSDISIGSTRFKKNPDYNLLTYTLIYSDGKSSYQNNDFKNLLDKSFTVIDTLKEDSANTKISHYTMLYDSNKLRSLQKNIFKNFTKDIAQAIFYFDGTKQYNVQDKLVKYNYTVTNETKNILGYLCKKAVFSNGAYAWFAVDLPIPAGPDTLHGLPGLVLEYQGKYDELVATNIQIKKANTIVNDLVFTGAVYTNDEFVKKNQEDTKIKSSTFLNEKQKLAPPKRYQFN